ncbi:hypothetical protein [Streptomyces specialis]|uniref:hypothetical protein n=1 Tax=Streptomyces specialis TaxID=498367 RepID=UPI00073F2A1B|nr:hypothetical protein [Streptomyces specialis]
MVVANEGVNVSLRRLRTGRKRTQEEIVGDLQACADRMYAEGEIARRATFSLRQYRKWEKANPPMPHPLSQRVLEMFFQRPVAELGFLPPAAIDTEKVHASQSVKARTLPGTPGTAVEIPSPIPFAPSVAAAPGEAGDPTNRRSALTILGGTALSPMTAPESVSADTVRHYTRQATHTELPAGEIESLELAVHQLAAAYQAHAPLELWPVVAANRHRAFGLREHRHTLREGRDIAHHAGMLSVIMAWIAHDMGRRDLVAALCDDAWHQGEQAQSLEVCAWAEDVRASDALYDNRPLDALTAATRGLAVAPRNSNAHIRLSAQLARAHARIGNGEAYTEAATVVHRYGEHIALHGAGLFSVDLVRVLSYDASSYIWLGDHARAQVAAVQAIEHYEATPSPHRAPTRLAIAQLDLALAHTAQDEPDAAIAVARRAFDGDRLVQSVRDRATQLRRSLLHRYSTLAEVRSFGEELRTLTS